MKAAEFVEMRLPQWRRLDALCGELELRSRKRLDYRQRLEFASLYRGACADLALADANQIPEATVRFLHRLVARAHNQLYRSKRFELDRWLVELFKEVPRRLFHDPYLRVAFLLFWGGFLASYFLASRYSPFPHYAITLVGADQLAAVEQMHGAAQFDTWNPYATGFYVFNNTSIGIRCFAMGLLLGIGGLFATVFNALFLGAIFGYMTTVDESTKQHFFEFVTAHGPFELNAIVLSAAAGMRLGFSLVSTQGLTRPAALAKAGRETLPTMGAAVLLFFLAAMIEGLLSPSAAPYAVKALVAGLSTLLLLVYFVVLGTAGNRGDEEVAVTPRPASPFDEPAPTA